MKRLLNWFFGSFFRTLGRLLCYLLIGFIIMLIIFKNNVFALEGLNKSGDSLKGNAKIGTRVVGSNYYYVFDSGVYDSSALNINFATELNSNLMTCNNPSCSGTTDVYFYVDYCINGSMPNFVIWSSYSNNVDFSYSLNNSIYLADGDWSKAQCYRSFISLNLNYLSSCNVQGENCLTTYTNNNNTFGMMGDYGYSVLLRYTDLVYLNSADYSALLYQAKQESSNNTIINQNQTIINQNNQVINGQNQINNTLTDDSAPSNLDSLNNAAGWLPAGPVDGILNLPLSFLTNLNTNLSKSCQPVDLPLPFVDKTLPLPCVNSLYAEIEGLPSWINTIGIIASAFILFSYLINLYKYVDDTLTFRENNYIDNWSGV